TFCRKNWFQGQPIKGVGVEDIAWFLPNSSEVTDEHWAEYHAKSIGIYLNGKGLKLIGSKGEKIVDGTFYLVFDAHHDALEFTLPPEKYAPDWVKTLDTAEDMVNEDTETFKPLQKIEVQGHSIIVFKHLNMKPEGQNVTEPTVTLEY